MIYLNSDVLDEQKNLVLKDTIQLIRVREGGLPPINPFGSQVYVRSDAAENTSLLKCLISIGEYIKSSYDPSKEQLELINSWEDQVRHRVKTFMNGKVIDGTGCPKCSLRKVAESSRKMMIARYASHADSKKKCIE